MPNQIPQSFKTLSSNSLLTFFPNSTDASSDDIEAPLSQVNLIAEPDRATDTPETPALTSDNDCACE